MSEEAPTPTPPPAAAAQAAAAAAAEPASPPAPEPEPELEDLPEGDTFDRSYVEKIRGEAAKYRTRARTIEQHFEGYSEAEKDRFLELASKLRSAPEDALEEFQGVTERLAKQLGKEINPVTDVAPEPETTPARTPEPETVTADDIARLVDERLAAERAAAEQQSEVDRTFAEAEALDPGYADPAAKAHLFAVAQHNQTDLAGAHEIIQNQLQAAIDDAVQARLDGIASGKAHPPRLPAGDPANVQAEGPPKTLEEAGRRARARLNAAYEQG